MDDLVSEIKRKDLETFSLFYDDVMGWISKAIRGMFIAEKGKKLLIADYNAIEARVLFWLAEEEKGLTAYREGRDIYADTAKAIYNKQSISKDERQLGKITVLGAGYGMGAVKFATTCATYGVVVDASLAEKAISRYRALYNAVPRFWRNIEQAAVTTVQTGKSTSVGKISFSMDRGTLLCLLPSGRSIAYNQARVDGTRLKFWAVNSVTHQWEEDETYGGKLCENVCQAVARDILAEAMFRAERKGYPIVMHVHDEAVSETDKPLDGLVKELEVVPAWARGLPLKVEGFTTERYRK
jgi:DNA polymerase